MRFLAIQPIQCTAMDCPNCKLVNPPTATRCDCGYAFRTPTMQESDPSERDKQHLKKGLASAFKAVAGIAGFVFFMAPVTNMGILVSVIALMVAITTGV